MGDGCYPAAHNLIPARIILHGLRAIDEARQPCLCSRKWEKLMASSEARFHEGAIPVRQTTKALMIHFILTWFGVCRILWLVSLSPKVSEGRVQLLGVYN
jgi:hypothetical protein